MGKQLEAGVSRIAADCGLSAYNAFITDRVKVIVERVASEDLTAKIQTAVDEVLVQKHENVKLSDIFSRFRDYVMSTVGERDKYNRQHFVSELNVRENGAFTHYTCRFSEEADWEPGNSGNVEIRFCQYREDATNIGSLSIDGYSMENKLRLGFLTEFERFVTNLYFNSTKIVMDVETVNSINDNSYVDY